MNEKDIQLLSLLMDVEVSLRVIGCWDASPPSLSALSSEEPFCIDTMEFYQWVQWIFIPKITQIIQNEQLLPAKCSIAPMAEEWAKSRSMQAREFITTLENIDLLITHSSQ